MNKLIENKLLLATVAATGAYYLNKNNKSNNLERNTNINNEWLEITEDMLEDKNCIFKEVYIFENIIPKKDCHQIINEAEKHANLKGGWGNDRHIFYSTYDIDIRDMYRFKNYIYNLANSSILPKVADKFNLNLKYLNIKEIFIVKYCLEGQRKLEEHTDANEFSFIIPLNKDYIGGGTKFKFKEDIIDPDIGNCTIFCGQHKHKGVEIKSGIRYILTGFLHYGWDS